MNKPMWNEPDNRPDVICREIEQQVDIRARAKRLVDCALPEGFRLLTPRPKQFWIGQQVVWGFCLAWGQVDRMGNRGKDEFYHVERYDCRIADEVQMEWAITEFSVDLAAERQLLRMRAA